MTDTIHECARCGNPFNLSSEGTVYQGREGLVYMCEAHIPTDFCDEALAEDMGLHLREEPDYWGDE